MYNTGWIIQALTNRLPSNSPRLRFWKVIIKSLGHDGKSSVPHEMSAGFLCGITVKLFRDKCCGQPLSVPVITQCVMTSASSQTQFYNSMVCFFLYSPGKKRKGKKAHQNKDSLNFPFSWYCSILNALFLHLGVCFHSCL